LGFSGGSRRHRVWREEPLRRSLPSIPCMPPFKRTHSRTHPPRSVINLRRKEGMKQMPGNVRGMCFWALFCGTGGGTTTASRCIGFSSGPLAARRTPRKRRPHGQESPQSTTHIDEARVCAVLVTSKPKHTRAFRGRDGRRAHHMHGYCLASSHSLHPTTTTRTTAPNQP